MVEYPVEARSLAVVAKMIGWIVLAHCFNVISLFAAKEAITKVIMADISSKMTAMKALLPTLENALKSFTSSDCRFKVIRTVTSSSNPSSSNSNSALQPPFSPRTLLILDSSYNPPSRAHLALASSAVASLSSSSSRLLLLFSTHNADKAPSPASFTHRLAMMILFAEDLQAHLYQRDSTSVRIPVDIGLTTAPYYTDKSTAIATEEPLAYPSKPTHIHLLGYDTLVRFLAPKYYSKFDPPLSALSPFFGGGHRLLVLLRPDSSSDNAVTGDSEEEQRGYISKLCHGSLEKDGFKREWADQIGILEGDDVKDAIGISSTEIRKAAKQKEWSKVEQMCTPGIATWLREMGLYQDDSNGAEMP